MKKFIIILFILFSFSSLYSQENTEVTSKTKNILSNLKLNDFSLTYNEGLSYAQITRIEILDNRSNFVRENFLAGAFFNIKTDNLSFVDFVFQIDAYYPFYQAFNGMRQFPKNMISYAFDGYLGALFSYDKFKYVLFDFSLGMHYMYHLTDEYHMNYLGLGTLNTIELPLTKGWSIVNNYFFSYDNANLGSNKNIQKFDAAYQYHIDLGVRYTRKAQNPYYYINLKKNN